ncbi:putative alpha beta-hydrolase [Lyophyllum shimeji]|uniref:Alpha beta-hydrolase n=1 Tax=Lyophyllum shimeji TaxID=47721 RepID=A0A9P3UNC3_LYOSH|nr:putative alpha beta-hydrolase [Lyophyllum shimeji]
MPVNALTTEASLKVGPIVLETLLKHYFDRRKTTLDGKPRTPLRQEELMYDEAFNVVKSFLRVASFHTVEDVQGFGNTRTPSPPWVHVVRLLVPMSSCDEAAKYLITALGGEETARRVVGGVKWWQVRGINGVDAQWITAKKDWEEAKRRHKMQEKAKGADPTPTSADASSEKVGSNGSYQTYMDGTPCMLYSHGGGYYFGSVDQERYSIQRHARKINGRVFAVNYRLAPQYPFPCALQDLLAAYLFLIRPPPGAPHRPVDPALIVVTGDSAGGGLSLALLQVIRDTGLPMPAGGVLISPWCDLTHSLPSCHTNTATDVIPPWGLSMQKPSLLWPPPPNELSNSVRASLRSRIRQVFRTDEPFDPTASVLSMAPPAIAAEHPVDVGTTTPLPTSDSQNDPTVALVARSGELLSTNDQLHMYTVNRLIPHPLVSPILSYLGGLPPLLIIAGDKEVLRDEIMYTAHKAVYPDKYPIKDESRALYPPLNGIEGRYGATKVHLQVYDDAAHVLPVLFSFTTPAKYCFRAIATFCKKATGFDTTPSSPTTSSPLSSSFPSLVTRSSSGSWYSKSKTWTASRKASARAEESPISLSPEPTKRQSLRRSLSTSVHRAANGLRPRPSSRARSEAALQDVVAETPPPISHQQELTTPSDVGGPRFETEPSTPKKVDDIAPLTAGDPRVYEASMDALWDTPMLRERVSTQGIIRPLEPEDELQAFTIKPELIGEMSELTLRRYLDAKVKFDKKFRNAIRHVEKARRRQLKLAKQDTKRNMAALHLYLTREEESGASGQGTPNGIKDGLLASAGSWTWAWVLDGDEHPPPSSIVSRRDTAEARRLAKVADQYVLQDEQALSGNSFWQAVINFLTITPDRDNPKSSERSPHLTKRPSRLSRFLGRERRGSGKEKDEGHPSL